MKFKKPFLRARQIIAIGLLLVTLPLLINDFIKIPEFIKGFLMGLGIVFEIMGLIKLKKAPGREAIDGGGSEG